MPQQNMNQRPPEQEQGMAQGQAMEEPVEEDAGDPELQAEYEALNARMNELVAGNPETFQALYESYVKAQESDVLPETAGQNAVGIIERLMQETGVIDNLEILLVLMNDIIADIHDLFGLEITPEEEERALAAAVATFLREHSDKIQFDESEMQEINRILEENVAPETGGVPQQGQPQQPGAPAQGGAPVQAGAPAQAGGNAQPAGRRKGLLGGMAP